MNGNYVRITSLSFSSIEIYMLLFLIICFFYILLHERCILQKKLIYMYILSLPYTESVYRIGSIQIAELIIILLFIVDLLSKRVWIFPNALIRFMVSMSIVLSSSTIISILNNVYVDNAYGSHHSPINSILNNIKFVLIIYMAGRILVEISDKKSREKLISVMRFSGNLTAFATILQAAMYKLGIAVPGIFEMWGIPRAKGLSHEPATNAFILLTTIALSTIQVEGRRYKLYKKSLCAQMIAFLICFSSGAIPIMILFILLLLFITTNSKVIFKKTTIVNSLLVAGIFGIIGFYAFNKTNLSTAFYNLQNKVMALFTDYMNSSNVSGRGDDIGLLRTVMKENPLVGIGAFNATEFFPDFPCTNTYFILVSEVGIIGSVLLLIVFLIFCRRLWSCGTKTKATLNFPNICAYLLVSMISIFWLRVLFFHQIWIALVVFFLQSNEVIKDTISNMVNENRA